MYRHTLVNHFFENSALRLPEKTALIYQDKKITYAEIDSMSNSLAHALIESGIKRGDRVAVFMDNSHEAVLSIFAALKAGAAFIVINHTTKAEKLEYILNNSRSKALLAQSNKAEIVKGIKCPHLQTVIICGSQHTISDFLSFENIINSNFNGTINSKCIDLDLASIIYTSSSTGNPKGVMLSHLNMVSAAHSITTYLENTEDDIIINVLPMSFDYGLYQILMGFKIGSQSFSKNHSPILIKLLTQ